MLLQKQGGLNFDQARYWVDALLRGDEEGPMPTYTVIKLWSETELAQRINEMIAEGWWPQGGVAVDAEGHFYQAMVFQEADQEQYGKYQRTTL
jgi:hypothetical protein